MVSGIQMVWLPGITARAELEHRPVSMVKGFYMSCYGALSCRTWALKDFMWKVTGLHLHSEDASETFKA